jgi:hypothetical protein
MKRPVQLIKMWGERQKTDKILLAKLAKSVISRERDLPQAE